MGNRETAISTEGNTVGRALNDSSFNPATQAQASDIENDTSIIIGSPNNANRVMESEVQAQTIEEEVENKPQKESPGKQFAKVKEDFYD